MPKIRRLYLISLSHGEVYFLRYLLAIVKGPTYYEDLRLVPIRLGEVLEGNYELVIYFIDNNDGLP